jgi:uncharacterized 2Fe-2S/4Fe-4S cluster protein (DUF4445 family)
LCKKSLVNHWQIYELTAAGNTTMQHLFLSVPVEQIAQAPYVAAVSDAVNIPASALGIDIHPEGNVYVMPVVAGHVGGDTVAVGLATAMRYSDKYNLAIDIGTNGEVIVGNSERLLVCSTAAGPAFEGARIRHGMRGAAGAIERVYVNDDIEVSVIGQVPAVGICGSGLIDALSELLSVGVIESSGRIREPGELPESVPAAVRERVVTEEKGAVVVLVRGEETRQGEPILLTQRDVREAQLGKAAIFAGVKMLMDQLEVSVEQIDTLYLAGAFGNYIRPESARRIGLLPALDLERIMFVGNAAGTGAKEVLLSKQARGLAENLAREFDYVELAGKMEFQMIFSESMFFPEK